MALGLLVGVLQIDSLTAILIMAILIVAALPAILMVWVHTRVK